MESYYVIDNNTDLDKTISVFEGYWKFQSNLLLKKLNLPVLDGIILTKWNNIVAKTVDTFCRNKHWEAVLIRHDKKPESPPYPRGGYIVSLEKAKIEANKFLDMGRIVFLMEPCSPFDNSYCMNILVENKQLLFEIVGPGFDASDLKRGDVSPHEVIGIERKFFDKYNWISKEDFENCVNRIRTVEPGRYRESVKERYVKIAKQLDSLKKINLEIENIDENKVAGIAKKYLEDNDFKELIANEKEYIPIPIEKLYTVFTLIQKMPQEVEQLTKRGTPFVISLSFVLKGKKLIFWDIVWPKLKYQL